MSKPPWHPARHRINTLNAKRRRLIAKDLAPSLPKAVLRELANQAAIARSLPIPQAGPDNRPPQWPDPTPYSRPNPSHGFPRS